MKGLRYLFSLLTALTVFCGATKAQNHIEGRVTAGISEDVPLGNIMLETSSGSTSFTNNAGLFTIGYAPHDTLFFYYQGKRTVYYLTDTIPNENFYVPLFMVRNRVMEGARSRFNRSLLPPADTSLNNVTVTARNYSQDSLDRRQAYAKAFGYTQPKMKFGQDWTPMSLNVGKLYETLNKSKIKKNKMLKENLLREEHEDYVTSRFNPSFVKKYLGENVSEAVLEDFMKKGRPKFEDIQGMSDLELIYYVRRAYAQYKLKK